MVKTLNNLILQNQKAYDLETWYVASARGATYFVFEVSCFRFCQIKFVCIDVGMCDPVHDVETVFHLC